MSFLNQLGSAFDYQAAIRLVIRVVTALLCLSVHELCHGLAAYSLGDPTARNRGRLSLNPLHHIDPLGMLLLIVAGFGWAKPVPVNPGYFRKPKQGMALTALAGPASNFLMALLSALLIRVLFYSGIGIKEAGYWVLVFLAMMVWLNLGLGLFNLFPIPPLDGSKVLFSVLPDHIYMKILMYERYVMFVLFAIVFFGFLDKPLFYLMLRCLTGICTITGVPSEIMVHLINAAAL